MYAYLLKYCTNPSMQPTKQAAQHARMARTAVKRIALDNWSINNGINEMEESALVHEENRTRYREWSSIMRHQRTVSILPSFLRSDVKKDSDQL